MFNIRINLCVFLYTISPHNLWVVSSTKEKYSAIISELSQDISIKDCILNTLDDYAIGDITSSFIHLLDIEKQGDYVNVLYVCRLPIGTKLRKGYNIPHQQVLTNPLIKKCYLYV